ncbi:MAG TPA: hypothetical protein EYH20_03440, partial [Leucothrix sp.]|nr:hypothetical protein [Leucothrix sp.]
MKLPHKNKLSHILLTFFFLSSFFALSGCNTGNAEVQNENQVSTQTSENDQTQKPVKNESAFSWQKLSGWHTQGTVSRDAPIR